MVFTNAVLINAEKYIQNALLAATNCFPFRKKSSAVYRDSYKQANERKRISKAGRKPRSLLA